LGEGKGGGRREYQPLRLPTEWITKIKGGKERRRIVSAHVS
jgi:hypothetical protein